MGAMSCHSTCTADPDLCMVGHGPVATDLPCSHNGKSTINIAVVAACDSLPVGGIARGENNSKVVYCIGGPVADAKLVDSQDCGPVHALITIGPPPKHSSKMRNHHASVALPTRDFHPPRDGEGGVGMVREASTEQYYVTIMTSFPRSLPVALKHTCAAGSKGAAARGQATMYLPREGVLARFSVFGGEGVSSNLCAVSERPALNDRGEQARRGGGISPRTRLAAHRSRHQPRSPDDWQTRTVCDGLGSVRGHQAGQGPP